MERNDVYNAVRKLFNASACRPYMLMPPRPPKKEAHPGYGLSIDLRTDSSRCRANLLLRRD